MGSLRKRTPVAAKIALVTAGASAEVPGSLSARNDVLANVANIAGGLVTAYTLSVWPDLLVGLGIAI